MKAATSYQDSTADGNSQNHSAKPDGDDLPREPFPTSRLPEPLRTMVWHASKQTGTPESLCAAAGLAVASASIGGTLKVRSGPGRETYPNLFILAFANSGSGKGQAFSVMSAPWLEEGRRLADEWKQKTRPGLLAERDRAIADIFKIKTTRIKSKHESPKKSDAAGDATEADAVEDQAENLFPSGEGSGQSAFDAFNEAAPLNDGLKEAHARRQVAEDALARYPQLNFDNVTAEAVAERLSYAPLEAGAIISAGGEVNTG